MRFLDTHGNQAEIAWNPVAFGVPLAVWVFVFQGERLALARHREGWLQWVIGTLRPNERPEEGARRSAYEQLGARIAELTPVGQFRGIRPDGGPRRSTIFTAVALRMEPVPVESGMAGVELVDTDDLTLLRDGGRFMHDSAFAICMTFLAASRQGRRPEEARLEDAGPALR